MRSTISRTYFRPLTGLRAIAALLVFCSHSHPLRFFTQNPLLLRLDFSIGVNVFFVLSGFLIALRYAEHASFRWDFWRRYLANRLARVYPMWWLLATVALLWRFRHLAGSSARTEWLHYVANLTFLKGYSSTLQFTHIQQGWTLTVEETFYLLAPVLLILWRKGTRPAVLFGGAAVALLALGSLLTEALHGRFEGFFSDYRLLLCWTLAGRSAEFSAGAGLALWLIRRGDVSPRTTGRNTWLGLAGTGIVVVGVACLRVWQANELLVQVVGQQLLLTLPLVALLHGLLAETTWVSRVLGSPAAVLLGKASYIFYLIHMGPVHEAIHAGRPVWTSPLAIAADLLLLAGISVASYYALEAPLNRWLRNRLSGGVRGK
ncbi:acyltransferase [Hymenobacter sp. 5317J-9]|uniref:acyltransferase family protein n=1 Tax=Hymenobacter sp. 5317J-9 TaxID=2932250 RepID=UPI001FD69D9B|nr:acyltransferase [Hymenobacter sp. 5317J-9]UOQ96900.1 acyltransferase [Hymenobacter sp. 5317J-9]